MQLELMYITNNPVVARIAEKNGVGRIWVDLEKLGKEERQKNRNTVKSNHTIEDVQAIARVLTKSELLVRINPWNPNSKSEIDAVIEAGADRVMLPMWRTYAEVDAFFQAVDRRVKTTLLLETKEAVECCDMVLKHPLIDEIHIGLNDLHISYGLTFMFELLANGTVEALCKKIRAAGVPYGFGGIARIGEGMLPAEMIVMEHYRLGSTRAILSRGFCNAEEIGNTDYFSTLFFENICKLREYERSLIGCSKMDYSANQANVYRCVGQIVEKIKEQQRL